ncbi:hypothetical protein GZL_01671 [Streptomyces sp. 769]|nr:hypothetical protein GZL_01671 [Streptomyces sp. 769]
MHFPFDDRTAVPMSADLQELLHPRTPAGDMLEFFPPG